MFWGLIMEPQRRYAQKVKKSFHVSMAAFDASTNTDEPAQVMCSHEGRTYLLCTLKSPDMLQCSLDLNFEAGSEISFATNGKTNVHLTGYLLEDNEEDGEEELVEDQNEKTVSKKKKRNTDKTNGPASKKIKVSDDLDFKSMLLGTSMDEDDDDDDSFTLETEEVDDSEGEEKEEDADDDDEVFEDEDEEDDEDEDDQQEVDSDDANEDDDDSSLSEDDLADEDIQKHNSSKKLKANEENGVALKKKKKTATVMANNSKTSPSLKKETTLKGGVVIEDIKEGGGPLAKNGQFVTVYYEGRLKQNNKIFDATNKGNGFRFRLGAGEVIKGWDLGVAGMKVGGKRKITCPPAMAYGVQGSPPAIPANSTLIFEVELKKVSNVQRPF